MTRSVVTGGAGFVGSHLVERLLALDHEVVAVDCFSDYYDRARKESHIAVARRHERFRLIEDDIARADCARLIDGADHIFHLAAQPGVRGSWGERFAEYVRNNILATQRLLEAARDAQPRALVFASSSSVYGNADRLPAGEDAPTLPVSPYGVTKLAAEHLCSLYARAYGVPVVSLRLFTVYGPRQRPDMAIQRFLTAIARDEPVTVFGDGSQTRDFTFVADATEAFVLAAGAKARQAVYNICGGSRISVNELLDVLRDVTGHDVRVERQDAPPGDARHTFGDNTRAREALGLEPKVDLRDGIEAQWRAVREELSVG
jgi:UDP-glucose 4-epimerase